LAKQLGSSNPLNNARAATDALLKLRTFSQVCEDKGLAS
jgi:small subunit ribosomal protein S5